jgi:hypothetical protein
MEIKGISDRVTVADGRVEVRGGGCLPVMGILFLLLGAAPIVAFLVFGEFSLGGLLIFGFNGLFFIAVGAWLTFGRYAIDIDGHSRTYRKRFGMLVAKETAGSLDGFCTVTVSRRERQRPRDRGGSTTYTDYPIRLEGSTETLDIAAPDVLENARRDAEQVAKALGFPLADRTGPAEFLREAGHLDESLRERRRRTGAGPGELPPPPEGLKTHCRVEGQEVVLEIPPAGFAPAALRLLTPAIAGPAVVLFLICQPRLRRVVEGPDMVLFAYAAGFFVFVVGIFIPIYIGVHLFLRAIAEHYTVRVSAVRLQVTTRGLFLSRVAEIPAHELEKLHITAPQDNAPSWEKAEIVARSDRTTIAFGRHLPPEEKTWIKAVLEHVLTE